MSGAAPADDPLEWLAAERDRPNVIATIVERVKQMLKFFDPEKIYLNPDCGFGTFAERCVNTPEVAYRKLSAISGAAQILRKEYT
jgi:5-methyltetrahydropteroyltriglutamate--homocysteine methyltransferase